MFYSIYFVLYYCFGFRLLLWVSSTDFVLYYGKRLNFIDLLQPIFKPVAKRYFFISGNVLLKI